MPSGASVDDFGSEFSADQDLILESINSDTDSEDAYTEIAEEEMPPPGELSQATREDEELSEIPSSPSSITSFLEITSLGGSRPPTPLHGDGVRNGPDGSNDLLMSIPAMYRILDLVSERGSGGLGEDEPLL
jgi:hypothetical protein